MKTIIGTVLATVVFLLSFFIDPAVYGLPGISLVEQRMVGIFIAAAIMWITECVPTWVTSVVIILVMILTVSNSGLWFLCNAETENMGVLIDYKAILASFADPVVMLFLGGFALAIGVTKTGLDVFMAKGLLKPFGTNAYVVLLGFILVTALFSAFISNTATAAMMLAFLGPVLRSLPADGKGRIALAMAIPIGANLGGMATPIGTPPNGVAMKYLNDELALGVDFSEWTSVMTPLTLFLLLLGWVTLIFLFPFKQKKIELKIEGDIKWNFQTIAVACIFLLTIIVWFTGKYNGINANAAAILPVALLAVCGVLGKKELAEINWSVLWMVAGGFALGIGFSKSGLAEHLVTAIPFGSWPALLVLIGSGLLCWILSNFISNSATAALLIPILCAVGVGMGDALVATGGVKVLIIGVAMAASLAMTMPISTPPNAIASSTGFIKQKDMAITGLIVGLVGGAFGYLYLMLFF